MGGTHSKQKMDVIGRSSNGFGNYAQRFDRTTQQRMKADSPIFPDKLLAFFVLNTTWTCMARCVDGIHGSRTPAGVPVV